MILTIDLVADAVSMAWRAAKRLQQSRRNLGKGLRLLLCAVGDVVGLEILGLGRARLRTVRSGSLDGRVAEVLNDDDSPAVALAEFEAAPAAPAGRPVDEHGAEIIGVRDAAALIANHRFWITRQLNPGSLRRRKVGSSSAAIGLHVQGVHLQEPRTGAVGSGVRI